MGSNLWKLDKMWNVGKIVKCCQNNESDHYCNRGQGGGLMIVGGSNFLDNDDNGNGEDNDDDDHTADGDGNGDDDDDDDDCLIIVGGSNFLDNDDNGNGED